MAPLTCQRLESMAELRAAAVGWDELWQRSDAALPTSRAELVAQWVEHFAPHSRSAMIVVRDGARPVAALPLTVGGPAGFSVGRLPGNAWTTAGELLLDSGCDMAAACDQLVRGLVDLRLPLIVFDGAATDRPSWRQFAAALVRQGIQPVVRPRFFVERLQLAADWQTFLAGRSRGLRRQIRRVRGRAEAAGTLRLQVLAGLSTAAVAKWLRIGLEIEDRGWKGRAASSVLKSPGMFDFYLEQARRAALWGQLRLVFLELDGVPIAFEYGWLSKGVYFSPKVAYDEAYAQLSPGQLLRAELVERFHADRSCESIDYLGPSSRATADWSTEHYPVARVLIPTTRTGRIALAGYETLRPILRRLTGQRASGEQASTGCEPAAPADCPVELAGTAAD